MEKRQAPLSTDESRASKVYIAERRVADLFQSLTVGLIYHRPDDHITFLLDCLQTLKQAPGDYTQNIFWDTFLPNRSNTNGALDKPSQEISISPNVQNYSALPEETSAHNNNNNNTETKPDGSSNVNVKKKPDGKGKLGKRQSFTLRAVPDLENAEPASLAPDGDGDDAVHQHEATSVSVSDETEVITSDVTMAVIKGSLENLPAMPRNSVRIFLSSTFSDFKAERNILPKKAYPQLQEYCEQIGLDFQVVDMRWGVTDELQNDHQVSELCIKEIATCQQVSHGPNFVSLIGNRYGYRPIPAVIRKEIFERLFPIVVEQKSIGIEYLKNWYKKDENSVPPTYLLQPIDAKLEFYSDMSEENSEKRRAQMKEWNTILSILHKSLTLAVKMAFDRNLMSKEELTPFLISVTEDEIKHGLLTANNAAQTCLCYTRNLDGIEADLGNPKSRKFIDVTEDSQPDLEAKHLLTELKNSKVPFVLRHGKVQSYSVPWKNDPLEESSDQEHLKYLEEFATTFVSDMKQLIKERLEEELDDMHYLKDLYHEVLHHAKFAHIKSYLFCGREESLRLMANYVKTATAVSPLIIGGESGLGKTSLLAYAARNMSKLTGHNTTPIVRFFGTSPQSSNILSVLKSVTAQICVAFGYTPPNDSTFEKLGQARRYLWSLLAQISEEMNSKLILFFDSVDQLSPKYGAHDMTWLPRLLPTNVFLIVSMLSDRYQCLQNAIERLGNPNYVLKLPPLSSHSGSQIISNFFKHKERRVTNDQMKIIEEAFSHCKQPLFLKLVLDIAVKWKSYTSCSQLFLPTDVHSAIEEFFKRLEAKFGSVFVRKALGYLTCARGGLTHVEMEDILSCDDDVLNEVYKYHDPPLEGSVRIPSLMWARLENEIGDYLVMRMVDGKSVLTWYHRLFWEAAEKRYLNNVDVTIKHHASLAELYDQETGIHRTIILVQRRGKVITDADRQVKPQVFDTRNIRKLNSLPYHLFKAGNKQRLIERCLLNFQWMFTKIKAIGIQEVFTEYHTFSDSRLLCQEKDLQLFCQFLELCFDAFKRDPTVFACHIIQRLKPYVEDSLSMKKMVDSAVRWTETTTTPILVPTHELQLLGLDSPLRYSLLVGESGAFTPDKNKIICSWNERQFGGPKVQVVLLKAKEVISSIHLDKPTPISSSFDGKLFYHIEDNRLRGIECETGDVTIEQKFMDDDYEKYTAKCLHVSDDGKYIVLCTKTGKPKVADKETWRQITFLVLFDAANVKQGPLSTYRHKGRRNVDQIFFNIQKDELLVMTRDAIHHLSVPELSHKHTERIKDLIYVSQCAHQCTSIALGLKPKEGAKLGVYDYSRKLTIYSEIVHTEVNEPETVDPFSILSKVDGSQIIFGSCQSTKNIRSTRLWLWDPRQDGSDGENVKQIAVGLKDWKHGECLCADPGWNSVYVGWSNGDISLVDLNLRRELYTVHAHGHSVSMISMLSDGSSLLTMGTDQTLKVWNWKALQTNPQLFGKDDKGEESNGAELNIGNATVDTQLHADVQCIDLTCTDEYVITAPHMNNKGPQFWTLDGGNLDEPLTIEYEKMYRKAFEDSDFKHETLRTHAAITVIGDFIFYRRQRRSFLSIFITKGIKNPQLEAYDNLVQPPCYFHQIVDFEVPGVGGGEENPLIFLVREGVLEIRNTKMHILRSIEIPSISAHLGNTFSSAAKRKLLLYRVLVTVDGKHCAIASTYGVKSTENADSGKYMDIVDIPNNSYTKRVPLHKTTSIYITTDSFYFLCLDNNNEKNSGLFMPSKLMESHENQYRCLIQSEHTFLSKDKSMGVEFSRGHSIRIYSISPLKKLQQLKGHSSQITSATFSLDNTLLTSTSKDTTVRIWNVATGEQLSLFSLYGAMEMSLLTPSCKYVVVHCYSAKQRKRAAIFRLHNMSGLPDQLMPLFDK